jgi:hypothetical protein
MKLLLTNLIFLGKMKINNYKFQQQQKAKQEYHKVKKIKEKAKKAPVSATEELDYIKKLLNGEEVEDFGPKEVEHDGISDPLHWKNGAPPLTKTSWATLTSAQMHLASQMSLSDYIDMMNGKGYYK